jgi:hypothetical protein
MPAPNTERLGQIVELLARLCLLLDGGYHYSSPLVRERFHEGKTTLETPVVHHNGLLDLLQDISHDLNHLGAEIRAAQDLAAQLGVDPVALCGADLPALGRAFDGLCLDLVTAVGKAHEIIDPPAKVDRPKRMRTRALASSPPIDGQSGLFANGDAEASTSEDQS